MDSLITKVIKGNFLNEEFSRHKDKDRFEKYAHHMATFNLSISFGGHISSLVLIPVSFILKYYYGYKPHLYLFIFFLVISLITIYILHRKLKRRYPLHAIVDDVNKLSKEQKKSLRRLSTWFFVCNLIFYLSVELPMIFFYKS